MAEILDTFTVFGQVPKSLYDDKPAMDILMHEQWLSGVEQFGGRPHENPRLHITHTELVGTELPIGEENWIVIFWAKGFAYRTIRDML